MVIKVERERKRRGEGGGEGSSKYLNKMNRRKEQPGLDRNYEEVRDGEGIYVDRVTYTIAIIPERTN